MLNANTTAPQPDRTKARKYAGLSITLVLLLEAAASQLCRNEDLSSTAIALVFLLLPLSPAIVAAVSTRPLCAPPAALSVAAWGIYANYNQCWAGPTAQVASTPYWGVWFYGLFTAVAVALLSLMVLRLLGVQTRGS